MIIEYATVIQARIRYNYGILFRTALNAEMRTAEGYDHILEVIGVMHIVRSVKSPEMANFWKAVTPVSM
jgi:hypothetical protein